MLASINHKYSVPQINDTCVVMCFFSPMEYKKPIENLKYNIRRLKDAKIPYVLIELLYPDQNQKIEDSIVVKSNSVLFSKENLWNLAANKYVPENYSKIIFLDSDIIFDTKNWFDLTSILLDTNDIVQPFQYAYRNIFVNNILDINQEYIIDFDINDFTICKKPITKAIRNGDKICLGRYEPGFAIGMTRQFFSNINGFFEYAITGSNDIMFWLSFTDFQANEPKKLLSMMPSVAKAHDEYKNKVIQSVDKSKINYLENCIGLHLYHGTKANRFYEDRNKYLPKDIDFYYNSDGVLEIKSNTDHKDLKQYWVDRKEDE